MAEDVSIFSEIDEALRADRLQAFWRNNRGLIVSFCILAVIASAASSWWKTHQHEVHEKETGLLQQGVTLSQAGKYGEAIGVYEQVENGGGALAGLAGLRHAEALLAMKQDAKAIALYNALADSKSDDSPVVRDYARLQADILAHNQTGAPVSSATETQAAASNIFAQTAAEASALDALSTGDTQTAKTLLSGIVASDSASLNARSRAALLLANMKEDKK